MGTTLNVAKSLESLKPKWEQLLYNQFPQHFEEGRIGAIHIGRNEDAAVGTTGGFKVRANQQAGAIFLDVPERMLLDKILADPTLKRQSMATRAADSVMAYANNKVAQLVEQGKGLEEAQAAVRDSISKIAYFDSKESKFIVEAVVKGVSDSMLSGMATPYWNISMIPKVFKQPYLTGYADRLVSEMGVPNMWADIIQIFTASYEGAARVSNVAHAGLEFNTSIAGKRKVGTMLSEVINLVVDYETQGPNEQMIQGQGAWLVGTTLGDQDVFADLMLKILKNTLIYFGHEESGFDGLQQIAIRDDCYTQYPDDRPTAQYLWEHDGAGPGTPANDTVGADLLLMLNHMIADKMEELHFLPTSVKINCGTDLFKALKFSMLSKQYNQNNPLSIIGTAFEAGNKIVGTLATQSAEGLQKTFEICPDVMLNANTPFNATDEDIMFMTFPSLQSAFEVNNVLSDLVMAPVPIKNMILPSAPGYRDGIVRTALSRIGSLLCPIRKTVHVVTGMGRNSRYAPASTTTVGSGGGSNDGNGGNGGGSNDGNGGGGNG